MSKQSGTALIEGLILLPLIALIFCFLFIIPILHMHKWNLIIANEELRLCKNNLGLKSCKGRDLNWLKNLEILKLKPGHRVK